MKRFVLIWLCAVGAFTAGAQVKRAEPLSWWTGMNTPLQILFQGEGIGDCRLTVKGQGVSVEKLHRADSPDFLFADITIAPDAAPGIYTFVFSGGGKEFTYDYTIAQRRAGSAERSSFDASDLVYLLMPDRFANGDPSNDSTEDTAEKSDRTAPFGRHGGDLAGMISRLDYMQDLGVTAVWSTPLLTDNEPQASYHGYACSDYYRIDPRYGTNGLYRDFVAAAHNHGIKVIMDVVTNHCGTAHWWMQERPFENWVHTYDGFFRSNYLLSAPSDPNVSCGDLSACTQGWFDTAMPDLNLNDPFLLHYFKQVFIWWIEWADLDGLRVDTFPYNDKYAMADFCRAILEEYPNLNIVGECWTSSPAMVAYWDGAARNQDGFSSNLPSVMDFPLSEAFSDVLKHAPGKDGNRAMKIYNAIAHDFLYQDPKTLMIFLDNHDTERIADVVDGDADRLKLGLTMLATIRGVPQLYYGTELLFRSSDLSQGHGGARVDFPGGWPTDTLDLFDARSRSTEQNEVYEHARKLFHWRKNSRVIHHGKTTHFVPQDNSYVYLRHDDQQAVWVCINFSDEDKVIDWSAYQEPFDLPPAGWDVLRNKPVNRFMETIVPANSSWVIEFTRDCTGTY